jgi:hypothetical protein
MGKSIGSDSPFWVVITNGYPKCILNKYRPYHGGSTRPCLSLEKMDITVFWGLRKALISWETVEKPKIGDSVASKYLILL